MKFSRHSLAVLNCIWVAVTINRKAIFGLDNLVGTTTQIRSDKNSSDILMDLNHDPLPFNDDTCIEVRSSHFLEHSNLDHVINESYRVLKVGECSSLLCLMLTQRKGCSPDIIYF